MIYLNADPAGGGGAPPVVTPPAAPVDWTTGLPDDLKTVVAAKAWKSPADALKSYRELETHIGQKRLPAPEPTWDEKQWGEFNKAIGVPDAPDKYEFGKDFKMPDGYQPDAAMLKVWQERLHKAGITPRQYQSIVGPYITEQVNQSKASEQAKSDELSQATQKLKTDWGDNYRHNSDIAMAAIKKFGGPELEAALESAGIEKMPMLLKAMHKIGAAMMDDKAIGSGPALNVSDPTSAKAEIMRLQGDEGFMKKFSDGDPAAIARWNELHDRAHPKERNMG